MEDFFSCDELAKGRLAEAGFFEKHLTDYDFPKIETVQTEGGDVHRLSAYNSVRDAETVVMATLPHTVNLADPSIRLRLMAQQIALGNDYALVGTELYNPKDMKFNRSQRSEVKDGFFTPFADRLLSAIEHLQIADNQKLALYGYSMGADVNIETTYQNMGNENRGLRPIDYLGIYEPCRMQMRGGSFLARAAKVGLAFNKSGPDLFKNITDTGSPALLEARGIDLADPDAEKKHQKTVEQGVARYFLSDVLGNLAITSGLGWSDSMHQLFYIVNHDMPITTITRMQRTTMNPADFQTRLPLNNERLVALIYEGDHSLADNLVRSASFVLETVRAK